MLPAPKPGFSSPRPPSCSRPAARRSRRRISPPGRSASFRSGIAAVAIFGLAPEARRGWSRRAVIVGVAYAACLTLFVLANRLTTSANTIYLQSTAPLYLLVLGPWLLKEPIRRQDLGLHGRGRPRAGAVLSGHRDAGGDGAGPGAREPPGGGERFVLGHHGVRTALDGGGGRSPRIGGGGGDVRQSHGVSRRLAVGAPAGPSLAGRLDPGRVPRGVPDRGGVHLRHPRDSSHPGARGVLDTADRAGAQPGVGMDRPGRAAGAVGVDRRRRDPRRHDDQGVAGRAVRPGGRRS